MLETWQTLSHTQARKPALGLLGAAWHHDKLSDVRHQWQGSPSSSSTLLTQVCDASQAVGSARRGSAVTDHCSWARLATAGNLSRSTAALFFTDIKGAYYTNIRQYAVGRDIGDDLLRSILARLNLQPEVVAEAILFVNTHGSLLQQGEAGPVLAAYLKDLNEETWFVIDGSEQVVQTMRGARPSESIADLFFIVSCANNYTGSLCDQCLRIPMRLALLQRWYLVS